MPLREIAGVLLVGWTVFGLCAAAANASVSTPAAHQILLKSTLALAALALVAIWRRRLPGTYGFERSQGVRWPRVVSIGLALGAASSIVVLASGGRGMQAVFGSMAIWQIVLIVWFGSSIAEEMFTRGWAQGALERWSDRRVGKFSVPVLTGAVLFGSMHISLYFRGVDPVTATVIVCSATVLGLWAGELREQHRGLAPAIGIHISFNAGGMLGGIAYLICYRLLTGRLPLT